LFVTIFPRDCTKFPEKFPEFSMFREIPEYSRFSSFVATLCELVYLTFVIKVQLRCGVAVIPRDVLHDAAYCQRRMRTIVVDVNPQRQCEPIHVTPHIHCVQKMSEMTRNLSRTCLMPLRRYILSFCHVTSGGL